MRLGVQDITKVSRLIPESKLNRIKTNRKGYKKGRGKKFNSNLLKPATF